MSRAVIVPRALAVEAVHRGGRPPCPHWHPDQLERRGAGGGGCSSVAAAAGAVAAAAAAERQTTIYGRTLPALHELSLATRRAPMLDTRVQPGPCLLRAQPGGGAGRAVRRAAVTRSEPAARTSRLTIPNYGFEDEVPGAAPPGTLLKTRNHGLRMARRVSPTLPLALACARAAHDCGRAVVSTSPHIGATRLLGAGGMCSPRPTPLHQWTLNDTPSSRRCSAWWQGGVWQARTSCRADFKLPRINTGPGSFFGLSQAESKSFRPN